MRMDIKMIYHNGQIQKKLIIPPLTFKAKINIYQQYNVKVNNGFFKKHV